MKIGTRVDVAGGSEEHPCGCLADVSFHLQTVQTSAAHAYETASEGCSPKGKFMFCPGACLLFQAPRTFTFPDL